MGKELLKHINPEPLTREVNPNPENSNSKSITSQKVENSEKKLGASAESQNNENKDELEKDAKTKNSETNSNGPHKLPFYTPPNFSEKPSLFGHLVQTAPEPISKIDKEEIKKTEIINDKKQEEQKTTTTTEIGKSIFGEPVSRMFSNPVTPLFGGQTTKINMPVTSNSLFEKSGPTPQNPPTGLFGNLSGNGGLFGQPSQLFANAAKSSIFGNLANTQPGNSIFGKFTINKAGDDSDDGDEDGAEDDEPKSESEDETKREQDSKAYEYKTPYEKVVSLPFEDLKIDKKDGIGAGIVSLERLKPVVAVDTDAVEKTEKKDNKMEFPMFVVRSKAKIVLSMYQIIKKGSSSVFLKNNKSCVSVIVFQIEKNEQGTQKLVSYNIKVKFGEEKKAEEFKEAFDKLAAN